MATSNPVEAALTDRIRMCVASGQCVCSPYEVNPDCPCHTVDGIALNGDEAEVASSVITQEFTDDGNE